MESDLLNLQRSFNSQPPAIRLRYAELNAYKKAMTLRKLAPNAELKSIELMRSLGIVPTRISVTIPGIPRSPSFEVRIRAVDE